MLDDFVEVECDNYHKKGYFKSSCPHKKKNGKSKKYHFKKESVDVVVAFDRYEFVRMLVASTSDT